MKEEYNISKKTWSKPELILLSLKKTETGNNADTVEDYTSDLYNQFSGG